MRGLPDELELDNVSRGSDSGFADGVCMRYRVRGCYHCCGYTGRRDGAGGWRVQPLPWGEARKYIRYPHHSLALGDISDRLLVMTGLG